MAAQSRHFIKEVESDWTSSRNEALLLSRLLTSLDLLARAI